MMEASQRMIANIFTKELFKQQKLIELLWFSEPGDWYHDVMCPFESRTTKQQILVRQGRVDSWPFRSV